MEKNCGKRKSIIFIKIKTQTGIEIYGWEPFVR